MSLGHLSDNHAQMHRSFRWSVPVHFNIAEVCSRRWAASSLRAEQTAVVCHHANLGMQTRHTYAQLLRAADALSHVLFRLGVKPGDRVAVVLAQRFETAVAYMAVLQMGAVAVPLSQLFGPEALAYRLQDSGAVIAMVDAVSSSVVAGLKQTCSSLRACIGVDERSGDLFFDAQAAHPAHQWPYPRVDW